MLERRGTKDKLAEFLRIFLEKQLISSVITIISTIVTILLIKSDNWMILKIGLMLQGVLFLCIYFLIIKLILKINAMIKNSAFLL